MKQVKIALSTAWTPQSMNVRQVLDWGIAHGFDNFEIGISPAPLVMKEIMPLVCEGKARIVSVHNVCTEEHISETYRRGDPISSLVISRREFALKKTFETMRIASQFGAEVVILHLGKVEVRGAKQKQLELIDHMQRLGKTREVVAEAKKLWKMRMERREPYLRVVIKALKAISENAGDLLLGVENRYFLHEIPSPEELSMIFDEVKSDRIGFWFDTGHAAAWEELELVEQKEWLDRFAKRLVGFHFHDVVNHVDHAPPGSGSLDFADVITYVRPDVPVVMELNARHTPEEVLAGRDCLRILFRRTSTLRSSAKQRRRETFGVKQ